MAAPSASTSITGRPRYQVALALWALVWFAVNLPGGGYSWHYFVQGSSLVFGGSGASPPGGLHVYANYPALQIGPVAFVVAQVLRIGGPILGLFVAQAVMMLLGLLVLDSVERTARAARPDIAEKPGALRLTMAVAGAAFLVVWASLSVHYAHLDDVLALVFAALAARALTADAPALTGLCLGLAVDAKPWAVVFLPLALVVARRRRRHVVARPRRRYVVAYALVMIALAWLPFVLADPGTLNSTQFTIVNEPSSALRALGVTSAGTPTWDRPAQMLIGCGLGAVAVWRRRWPAVLLIGMGTRIALDPGVYDYYTAGIMLGTLCWETLGLRRPVPFWSLTAFAALYLAPRMTANAALLGELRLALTVGLAAAVLVIPQRWCADVLGFTTADTPDGIAPARKAGTADSLAAAQEWPPADDFAPAPQWPPADDFAPAPQWPPADGYAPAQQWPPADGYGPAPQWQPAPPADPHWPVDPRYRQAADHD